MPERGELPGEIGRHVQIGLATAEEEGMTPLPTDEFVAKDIEFVGSLGLHPSRYSEMLDTMRTVKLDPTALVSGTIDIHRIPDRPEAMTDFGTMGIPARNDFTA